MTLDMYGLMPYIKIPGREKTMASTETHEKTARLEARITAEQKALFLRAAELTGRSLTDFVISCAYEAASRTVREHETMILSSRDREAFVTALLNPPKAGSRLRKAARRYKQRSGV